jgi:hypothetical protein
VALFCITKSMNIVVVSSRAPIIVFYAAFDQWWLGHASSFFEKAVSTSRPTPIKYIIVM